MSDKIDDIKKLWLDARRTIHNQTTDIGQIITKAEKKRKSTIKMYISTILILTVTLSALLAFFVFVVNFKHLLSHIGSGLMAGSLLLRIIIELCSIYLSIKINLSETALRTNNASMRFYNFRKRIHNPVTIIFIVLYTIGFYMLTPEFSIYFSLPMMLLIDGSYILGAAILICSIRKGIQKEMHYLREIIRYQGYII